MAYSGAFVRSLYERSPGWVKTLAVFAYAHKSYGERFGAAFRSALEELDQHQFDDGALLQQRSRASALELYEAARRGAPAYAETPALESADLWSTLPVLSKTRLKSAVDTFVIAAEGADETRVTRQTSGTTGTPLSLVQTRASVQRENAFAWQHRSWHGCPHGSRTATIAGHPVIPTSQDKPPFWVRNYRENQLFLSSVHMSESALPLYAEALERFSPELIHGYPSAVALAARGVLEAGATVRPKAVITASETLLPHQRRLIEDAFRVAPRIWYGNTELAGNIVECPEGRLHVREEHSYVEFLDEDDQPALPGESARLVATAFGNPAMGLVRYDTGDTVVPSAETRCECGRGGRLVETIVGRVEDYVIDGEGRMIGRLDHLFKDVEGVSEAQLVQDEAGVVVVKTVFAGEKREAFEESVRAEAGLRMSPSTVIRFEYVEALERTKAGKAPFILSRLPRRS